MSIKSALGNKSSIKQYTWRSTILFVLLFTISFSTPTNYIPTFRTYSDPFFEQLVLWTGLFIFNLQEPFIYQLTSDSTGAYLHTFNLLIISVVIAYCWKQRHPNLNEAKLAYAFYTYVRYYLALQLFLYGFNKVFKCQFFLPEPNTLYTFVGDTPKDLLFWSTMGSSYIYTFWGGALEVLAASLLLFRKTYLIGSLFALGILSNVLAINIGFNISVKLYASFFLFLSFILILPYLPSLYAFFIHQKLVPPKIWWPAFEQHPKRLVYATVKTLSIWLILFECLIPYFEANNFNDDMQARPPFHGAYEVNSFLENDVPIPALSNFTKRWKRVFVHRRNYFIVQTMDDKMQDYKFQYNAEEQLFYLTHTGTLVEYPFRYQVTNTGDLILIGKLEGQSIEVRLKELNWRKMPLLAPNFSWTIDAIQ